MNNEKTVWESEFDKEFVSFHPGDSGLGGNYPQEPVYELSATPNDVKDWIAARFVSKDALREKIEGMKPPYLWSEDMYQHNRNLERNNTIGEILALLNEQTS